MNAIASPTLAPKIAELNARLPAQYKIETGGMYEESAISSASVFAVVPLLRLPWAVIVTHVGPIEKDARFGGWPSLFFGIRLEPGFADGHTTPGMINWRAIGRFRLLSGDRLGNRWERGWR